MDPIIFADISMASERIGLLVSIVLNLTLAYLIIFKSHPQLGGYKNLMLIYCYFEMHYSCAAWISESTFLNTDMAFVSYRMYDGPYRKYAPLLLVQFCSCYFSLLLILSIHFVYRYCIVSNSRYTSWFEGWNIVGWVLAGMAFGFSGGLLKFLLLSENDNATEHLRGPLMEMFHVRIEDVVYNGPVFYDCRRGADKCEKEIWSWLLLIAFIFYVIFFLSIMVFFGLKIYDRMETRRKMSSSSTAHLQTQLFWALFFQTVIPLSFMYIPVMILYVFPMIGINLGAYSNLMMMCLAVYPPLDQFFIIYIIKDFRRAMATKICCCLKQEDQEPKSLVSTSI